MIIFAHIMLNIILFEEFTQIILLNISIANPGVYYFLLCCDELHHVEKGHLPQSVEELFRLRFLAELLVLFSRAHFIVAPDVNLVLYA